MATQTKLTTANDLLAMPSLGDGTRYELVHGELITMPPAGGEHGSVSGAVAVIVGSHVRARKLGRSYTADTGFLIRHDPDTVRAPDYGFVSWDRLPQGTQDKGFVDLAPEFAVEVVSPSDTATEINAKVEEYLAAGTLLVWVVYPDSRSVMAYRSLREVEVLHTGDELDGRPVFEDFRIHVDELFE